MPDTGRGSAVVREPSSTRTASLLCSRQTARLGGIAGSAEARPRQRWLRVTARVACVAVAIVASVLGSTGRASANMLTINGSQEGDMDIAAGDWVAAGYFLKMNGSHAAATIFMVNATVTLPVTCVGGGGGNIVVNLSPGPVTIPANDHNQHPTGDQDSPASFQGSVQAPDREPTAKGEREPATEPDREDAPLADVVALPRRQDQGPVRRQRDR